MQRARIIKKGALATPVLFWRSKMGAAAFRVAVLVGRLRTPREGKSRASSGCRKRIGDEIVITTI